MEQSTGIDYQNNILIPGQIPEHLKSHYATLKRAKRVIHILCQATIPGKEFTYNIQHQGSNTMVLPQSYVANDFQIRFLPGWGTYEVTLSDGYKIDILLPHGVEEFQLDLEHLGTFWKTYQRTTPARRRELLLDLRKKLQDLGRITKPTF